MQTAVSARMAGDANPQCGPSMVTKARVPSARIASAWPAGSSAASFGSRVSGTRLTGEQHREGADRYHQDKDAAPAERIDQEAAMVGPTASARPLQPAQMPIAWARAFASPKATVRIESDVGTSRQHRRR